MKLTGCVLWILYTTKVTVSFNPAHPAGRKVTGIKIGNHDLLMDAYYTLVTNDFLAAGGDGYTIFKKIMENKDKDSAQSSRVILFDSGRDIRDMVSDYIKGEKMISAKVEGRIRKEK